MKGIAARNYDRILNLACLIIDDETRGLPHGLITTELMQLLPSGGGFFMEVQLRQATASAAGVSIEWTGKPMDTVLHLCLAEHPLLRHYGASGAQTVLTAVDLVGDHTWQHSRIRHECRELLGVDQHVSVPLPAPKGVVRMIALGRPSDRYRPDEITLAQAAQRILASVANHLDHYQRWYSGSDTPGNDLDRLAAEYHLTSREVTVLALLAKALSARQVATQLSISHRTVHKHEQNLYRKLGVTNRVTAVRRAQSIGLLPDRRPIAPETAG